MDPSLLLQISIGYRGNSALSRDSPSPVLGSEESESSLLFSSLAFYSFSLSLVPVTVMSTFSAPAIAMISFEVYSFPDEGLIDLGSQKRAVSQKTKDFNSQNTHVTVVVSPLSLLSLPHQSLYHFSHPFSLPKCASLFLLPTTVM